MPDTLFKLLNKSIYYYHTLKVAFVTGDQLSMIGQQIIKKLKVILCATNNNEVSMMLYSTLNNDLLNLIYSGIFY